MYYKATQVLTAGAMLMTLLAAAAGVQAQQIYRIVGPDGRITYSDKPPAEPARTVATPAAPGQSTASAQLPFALRQVVSRYPVTLYSGTSCAPCVSAKSFLMSRGVPFTERIVANEEDGAALQRLSGDNTLPFMTIGSQQIKGFADVELAQFLDAAGYPKTSQLPATYRNPPAAPLVAVQRPAAAPAEAPPADTTTASPAPQSPPPATSATNPAGIRF